jgi:hypothetical protein
VLPKLQEQLHAGLYFRLVIPKGTYPGVTYDSGSVGVANALVVKDTMSDELAYELTKVLFDRQPDLAAIHPEAKKLNVETASPDRPRRFIRAPSATTRSVGVETVARPDVPIPTAPDDELESQHEQLTGWPARRATSGDRPSALFAVLGPRHRAAARPTARASC